jgi:hypothetical protein
VSRVGNAQGGDVWWLATMDEGVIAVASSYRQARQYAAEHFIEPRFKCLRHGFWEVNGESRTTIWFGTEREMRAEGWTKGEA